MQLSFKKCNFHSKKCFFFFEECKFRLKQFNCSLEIMQLYYFLLFSLGFHFFCRKKVFSIFIYSFNFLHLSSLWRSLSRSLLTTITLAGSAHWRSASASSSSPWDAPLDLISALHLLVCARSPPLLTFGHAETALRPFFSL